MSGPDAKTPLERCSSFGNLPVKPSRDYTARPADAKQRASPSATSTDTRAARPVGGRRSGLRGPVAASAITGRPPLDRGTGGAEPGNDERPRPWGSGPFVVADV